jgi:hypothetical protein
LEVALRIENGGLMLGKTAARMAWTTSAIPLNMARNCFFDRKRLVASSMDFETTPH